MKLTGELKDKVTAVGTKEEEKAIIADASMELNDNELESVAGGRSATNDTEAHWRGFVAGPRPEM